MTFDLDLWPTNLTINRDHLLIKDHLPTKFKASGAKRCWVIRRTRFGRLTWPLTFTFDLLTINRDHLLIKDYLPTKSEASGAKRCWVIRCTRFGRLTWPLTFTFDLLTWLSIGIVYSSRTIYLPRLKFLGQSVVELSVAQGLEDWHDLDLWPTNLTINRDHLLIKDYRPTKFEVSGEKRCWVIRCTRFGRLTWPLTYWPDYISIGIIYSSRTIDLPSLRLLGQSVVELSVAQGLEDWHDLWPWPTDLTINRDHLLIKDYLPTKFEASGAKRSWVIRCTRLRDTDIATDMCNAICPSFFEGGINIYYVSFRLGLSIFKLRTDAHTGMELPRLQFRLLKTDKNSDTPLEAASIFFSNKPLSKTGY